MPRSWLRSLVPLVFAIVTSLSWPHFGTAEEEGAQTVPIPAILGLSAKDAKAAVQAAGLTSKFKLGKAAATQANASKVYRVEPASGTRVAKGSAVVITIHAEPAAQEISSPPGARTPARNGAVDVPDFVGMSAKAAKAALQQTGLKLQFRMGSAPQSQKQALTVYAQKPLPGTSVARGARVDLTLYSDFRGAATAPAGAVALSRLTRAVALPFVNRTDEVVDPRSGRLQLAVTDLSVRAGAVSLDVRRRYQAPSGPPGLFGSCWQSNWECQLVRIGPQLVIREDGRAVDFRPDKDGARYSSASGEVLVLEAERAVRVKPDGTRETFGKHGWLVERDAGSGNKITLTYDAHNVLTRIDGPYESFLRFTTNKQGRVTKIESSTGATVSYGYDDQAVDAAPPDAALAVSYAYDALGRLTSLEHPQQGATKFAYDGDGRISKRSWADGTSEQDAYDAASRTLRHVDTLGRTTTTTWREDYGQATLTDPLGRQTVIDYNASGQTTAVIGPTGLTARMAYDALGRRIKIEGATTGTTKTEYLGATQLPTTIVGPGENRQTLEYDEQGELVRVTSTPNSAHNAEIDYFPDGQIKSVKMGTGLEQSYTYDAAGRRDSTTDAAGNKWQYQYDGAGNLVREVDPLGGVTARAFDAHGRLLSMTDAAGATTRFKYEQRGRLAVVTAIDARNAATTSIYDHRGRLVRVQDPAQRATRYDYNGGDQLVSVTDPAGEIQKYEYDAGGNLIAETNPIGAVAKCDYGVLGEITAVVAATGEATRFEYSPLGRLNKQIDAAGLATTYEYDDEGRLIGETDVAGRTTQFEYTPAGRLAKVIPPSGPIVGHRYDERGNRISTLRGDATIAEYEYDVLGRRTKQKHASGLEISYRYDAVGNLLAWQDNQRGAEAMEYDAVGRVRSRADAAGARTGFKYDAAGNLLEVTDPLGKAKSYAYDTADQLVEVAEPNGDSARYEYDGAGRLAAVHHPGGGTSSYEYDALGNAAKTVNPVGQQSQSSYDANGRLLSVTDAKGQVTSFAYDAAGRLVERKFADGKAVRFHFDRRGRVVKVDDSEYPVLYTYDNDDNITRIQYPAIKRTLAYEYNDLGLKTKFVDSEGRTFLYEYDASDRLIAIKLDKLSAIKFAYDPKGRMTSVTYPNGVRGAWVYDANDRPTKLTYTDGAKQTIAGWTYVYDAAGNLTESVEANGRTTHYSYDPAGQLKQESIKGDPQSIVRYGYLPGGNRGTKEEGGKKIECRYDAADRLLAAGDEKFAYDANGNLIERTGPAGTTRYEFDARDRLAKVVLPNKQEVSYGYAPTGERIWRRDARGVIHYVHAGADLTAELDANLKPRSTYVHGPGIDKPLVMTQAGEHYYFHADRLGSISRLTNHQGAVAAALDYDAFGRARGKPTAVSSPFAYTGREPDAATGLYYYRARYYDPAIGRFLSADAAAPRVEHPLSFNVFAYCSNNPVAYTDPLGLEQTFYQYTDYAGAAGVKQSGGLAFKPGHGTTGPSVFLTTIPPKAIVQPGVAEANIGRKLSQIPRAIPVTQSQIEAAGFTVEKLPTPIGADASHAARYRHLRIVTGPAGGQIPLPQPVAVLRTPRTSTGRAPGNLLNGGVSSGFIPAESSLVKVAVTTTAAKVAKAVLNPVTVADVAATYIEGRNNGKSRTAAITDAATQTATNAVNGIVPAVKEIGTGAAIGGLVGGVGGVLIGGAGGLIAGGPLGAVWGAIEGGAAGAAGGAKLGAGIAMGTQLGKGAIQSGERLGEAAAASDYGTTTWDVLPPLTAEELAEANAPQGPIEIPDPASIDNSATISDVLDLGPPPAFVDLGEVPGDNFDDQAKVLAADLDIRTKAAGLDGQLTAAENAARAGSSGGFSGGGGGGGEVDWGNVGAAIGAIIKSSGGGGGYNGGHNGGHRRP